MYKFESKRNEDRTGIEIVCRASVNKQGEFCTKEATDEIWAGMHCYDNEKNIINCVNELIQECERKRKYGFKKHIKGG